MSIAAVMWRLAWPFLRVADWTAKALLASPLHFPLSWEMMVIEFRGIKSGRLYRIGVSYRRHGDTLYSMTARSRRWWRNLRGGQHVKVLYKGRWRNAVSDVEEQDLAAIAAGLRDRDPIRRLYRAAAEKSVLIKFRLEPMR